MTLDNFSFFKLCIHEQKQKICARVKYLGARLA